MVNEKSQNCSTEYLQQYKQTKKEEKRISNTHKILSNPPKKEEIN